MKKLTKFFIMMLWVPTIVFAASDLNSKVREGSTTFSLARVENKSAECITSLPSSFPSLSPSTTGISLTEDDMDNASRIQFKEALSSIRALRNTHEILKRLGDGLPTCFISYARNSKAFNLAIQMLAEDLTRAGIIVKFDLWNNRAGTQISRFTEEISSVDFVVLACSSNLVQKHAQSESILNAEPVLNAELDQIFHKNNNKPGSVIPILFKGINKDALPSFLINTVYVGFQRREDYFKNCFELISRLYQLRHDDGPLRIITQEFHDTLRLMTSEPARSMLEEHKRKKEELEKTREALLLARIGRTLTSDLEEKSWHTLSKLEYFYRFNSLNKVDFSHKYLITKTRNKARRTAGNNTSPLTKVLMLGCIGYMTYTFVKADESTELTVQSGMEITTENIFIYNAAQEVSSISRVIMAVTGAALLVKGSYNVHKIHEERRIKKGSTTQRLVELLREKHRAIQGNSLTKMIRSFISFFNSNIINDEKSYHFLDTRPLDLDIIFIDELPLMEEPISRIEF